MALLNIGSNPRRFDRYRFRRSCMADSDVDGYLPCSIRLLFPNGDVMSKPGRSILRGTPDLPWPGCVTEISGLRNVCKVRLPVELGCRWCILFHQHLSCNCLGT